MSKEIGRNQPCPCGSGKKYKHCCWGTDAKSSSNKRNMYIFGGALVAILIVVFFIMSDEPAPPGSPPGQPSAAPPGKVWSSAHGHWHDAPGAGDLTIPASLTDSTPGATLTSQQPGTAPPGKVWSPEHGHWHDAPNASPFIFPNAQSFVDSARATPVTSQQPDSGSSR